MGLSKAKAIALHSTKMKSVSVKADVGGLKQATWEVNKVKAAPASASQAAEASSLFSFLPAIPGLASLSHKFWRRGTRKQIEGGKFAREFFDLYKPTTPPMKNLVFL